MGSAEHYSWIDIAKGIGIILVIMGHTMFPLHVAIDVFHMPLFFFIAGLILQYKYEIKDFLIKKINRIFIPYVFFYSLIFIIQNIILHNGPTLYFHLWFLQSMFVALIIAYVVIKYASTKIGTLIMLSFLLYGWCIARYKITILPMNMDRGILASGFVLLGYYLKPIVFKLAGINVLWKKFGLLFGAIIIYAFSLFFSLKWYSPICSLSRMDLGEYGFVLCMVTTLAGVFSVILFSQIIKTSKILEWLGKNSLIIFIFHEPFTEYLNTYFGGFAEGKGIIIGGITALVAYITYLSIGSLFVPICKKFIPKVSGYDNLIK